MIARVLVFQPTDVQVLGPLLQHVAVVAAEAAFFYLIFAFAGAVRLFAECLIKLDLDKTGSC